MGFHYEDTRKKQIYSREFLGVTLVRLTGVPRKATRVVSDHCVAALLPNGKVAISSGCDAFDPKFDRSGWSQVAVARTLAALGVIPKDVCAAFCAKETANRTRKAHENAAHELENSAERLGIELTKGQRLAIQALTAITA